MCREIKAVRFWPMSVAKYQGSADTHNGRSQLSSGNNSGTKTREHS